jgi:hypothetical protein
LGKAGDRCFDAGPQDFFCLNRRIIPARREALPINHTGNGEAERLFKFVNNDGDNYDGGASARRLAAEPNQARLKNGSMR